MEELQDQAKGLSADFISAYGPAILAMSNKEIISLIELIASGKEIEAWGLVLEQKHGPDVVAEFKAITAGFNSANKANADSIALQKSAITSIMRGVLAIALTLVGL